MRVCKKCGVEKALEDFTPHAPSKEGRTHECRACATVRKLEWAKQNPAKSKASIAKWRQANIEALREYGRGNTKRWQAANPEKVREYSIQRRARKKASQFYAVSTGFLKRLHAQPCIYCGSTKNIEADHVVPLARGGQHSIGNLVPACRTCNASKRDRFIMEWRMKCHVSQ